MSFKPYLEFPEDITNMQMWIKTKHPKWKFWKSTKYYMLIATKNKKFYQIDPDTNQIVMMQDPAQPKPNKRSRDE